MSALAKVFVIIVLILSVAQSAVYSTVFYHRTNWRKNYENVRQDYIKLAQHKDNLVQVREQRIRTLQQVINDYKDDVITYRNNLSSESRINLMLKTSLAQKIQEHEMLSHDHAKTVTQIKTLNETIDRLRQRIEDLRNKYGNARQREELAQAQVARLIRIKTDLESDLSEIKKQYLDSRKAQEALAIKLDILRGEGYPVDEVGDGMAPSIKGEVVAVIKNIDPNLILISVGDNMKVKKGYKFTIYRGNEFIARVVVEKVLPRFAGARVIFSRKPIETGDSAATHIQ